MSAQLQFTEHLSAQQRELFRAQLARQDDPATADGAQERVDAVVPALEKMAWRIHSQARAAYQASSPRQKIHWLRRVAASFAEVVEPQSACRRRCSSCCYQSVLVTEAEARVVARETGAPMQANVDARADAERFQGQPCPFLEDGQCSIYESRPMACRLLFNMDADDLLCRIIPGSPVSVPYANTQAYHLMYIRAHLGKLELTDDPQLLAERMEDAQRRMKMADVRDFFPQGRVETATKAQGAA